MPDANGFDGSKVLREGMDLVIPWSNVAGTARYGANGPAVDGQGLHFVASIGSQTCWLFQNSEIAASWPCSTGRPGSPSIPGNYTVQTKEPRAYNTPRISGCRSGWGCTTPGFMRTASTAYPTDAETGESRWQDLVGTPITYGCIMLDDTTAETLYTLAYIGMPVTILP